jgi:hypothetical protein
MEAVTNAASSAASNVNKVIFGEGTNKEQSRPVTEYTQRSGGTSSDSTASDSTASDSRRDTTGGGKFHPVDSGSIHKSSPSDFESVGRGNHFGSGSRLTEMGASDSGASNSRFETDSSPPERHMPNTNSADPNFPDDKSPAQIRETSSSASPSIGASKNGSPMLQNETNSDLQSNPDNSLSIEPLSIHESKGQPCTEFSVSQSPDHISYQSHQGDYRSSEQRSQSDPADLHRKSIPLVDGHPESSGPKTVPGLKLPTVAGTGEGTGMKHFRSTGVAAEGGNFDAAAAGAGIEAE